MTQNTGAPQAGGAIGRRRELARTTGGTVYTERRGEIVAAAADLFKAQGYRGTSLADIAAAVGTDRATLYYYVASKEELLDEVVTDVVKANLAKAEAIRDAPGPAPEKIRRLVTDLMQSYATHYPFLYVYLQENLAHVSKQRQAWSRRMRAVNRRYEAAIESIVAQGIDEGSIRSVTEPRVIAFGVMGMVSWTNRWFNPQTSTVDAAEIGNAYADILLSGMVTPTARRHREPSRKVPAPS